VDFSTLFRSERIENDVDKKKQLIDLPEGGVVEAGNRLGSSF